MRNTVLNLLGQVMPLLVATLAIPITVHSLGSERFGILALSWVVLGYFSFFDLGLGRATVRFAARTLQEGNTTRFGQLAITSALIHGVLGLLGAIVVVLVTPVLVSRVLSVPTYLVAETSNTLVVIAAALPVTLLMSATRGLLEAGQRFDLVNLVAGPTNALTYLLSAVGGALGLPVAAIVLLLLANRVVATVAYAVLALQIYPFLRREARPDLRLVPLLLPYGGWVTVTAIVGPILIYADRFFISALRGVAELGYYVAPFELVNRLWIVPASMVTTLFPFFGSAEPSAYVRTAFIYGRAIRYLLVIIGPLIAFVVLFPDAILQAWLGSAFAELSAIPLRLLAVGVLINSLGQFPLSLLHGVGRPSVPAKLHLVELVPFMILSWFLISAYGIAGAALGWTLRVTADTVLLSIAAARVVPPLARAYITAGALKAIAITAAAISACIAIVVFNEPSGRLLASALCLVSYLSVVWIQLLDADERHLVKLSFLRLFRVANRQRPTG